MFCQECGTQNPDDAVFCANCGSALAKDPITQGQPFPQTSPQAGQYQQGVPQQPVYQKPPKQPRKPMPKGAKIAIIAAIAVVILGTAGFMLLKSLASPKRMVENYAKAYVAHDSEKIFDLLCFEKSEFISPEKLEKALESQLYKEVTEYAIKAESDEDDEDEDNDTLYYTVTFRDKSHSAEEDKTITLEKSGKRFGIFDNWKIRTTNYVAKNCGIYTPAGTTVKMDGVELGDKYKGEEDGEYVIPACFDGIHELSVEQDVYEPYTTTFTVSATDYEEENAVAVRASDMQLSSAAIESLKSSAKDTVTGFYTCAMEQKEFSEVPFVEAVGSECGLDSEYSEWINNNVTSDTCIKTLEFTNTEETVEAYNNEDAARAIVQVSLSYNTTSVVKDYWSGKKEERSGSGTGSCSLYYEYQNGQWIIYDYTGIGYAIDYEKY